MALPTTLPASSKTVGTTGVVSPAEPTGVADGDLELLVASTIAGGSISITNNGGSSWTPLGTGHQDVVNGEHLYVWYRIRQAGDSAPSVQAATDHICCTIWGYHSVDQTTPVEAIVWSSETTSDTSFSFNPGNSTSVNDCVVCTVYSSGQDSNTGQAGTVFANASLTNVALIAEYQTTQGLGGGFAILEGDKVTAGTTGTWSDTMVNATTKSYVSFAVRSVQPANYTESATITSVTTPSSVEIQAHDYVEAATLAGVTALSAEEIYSVTYVDSATISGITDLAGSSEYYSQTYVDAATIGSATTPISDDIISYVDSATISATTTLSTTDTLDVIDLATVDGITELSAVENYDAVDAATVDSITTVSSDEVYTPSVNTQKGYPISDITSSGWSASTGTDLFACIDDPNNPDDGDYIYATATQLES